MSRWELGLHAPLPYYREQLCRLYGMSAAELGLVPCEEAAGKPSTEPERADERARRDLLGQVRRYWVTTQLEDPADPLPALDPVLVERPGAVDDPLSVSSLARRDRPLPPGAGIGGVYQLLGEQALILGEPGAGKTTLLLQLARELLDDPDPMPVVFHLGSWSSERRPVARWLADELHRRYGVALPLARRWIQEGQVLPLLDGLDEVTDRHRAACVAAINEFRCEHGQLPIVVCCRTAWYEAAGVRLALRGAVEIQPLPRQEVRRCLAEAGPELAGLRALVDEDVQLQELLTTPLFLKISAITYRDRQAAGAAGASLELRRSRILGDYVEAMLARAPSSSPPPVRTLRWLGWLAASMREHGQSVFYPEWMQPSWLPNPLHRWLVTRGVTAAIGISTGAIVGLNWGLDWGLAMGPVRSLLIGVTVGLVLAVFHGYVADESRIMPAVRLRWSWPALRRALPGWMRFGLILGLVGGLLYGLVVGLAISLRPDALGHMGSASAVPPPDAVSLPVAMLTGLLPALVCGAWLGLLIALAAGLLSGLDPQTDVSRLIPGGSLEASGRNALVGGVAGGVVFGAGFALLFGLATDLAGPLALGAARALGLPGLYWPNATPNDFVVAALVGGVVSGLQRGGGAYLRHRALLALLARSGFAPGDYIAFLEYATRLVLLRRRGAGYEFMHRMLLDHFADRASGHPRVPSPVGEGQGAPRGEGA